MLDDSERIEDIDISEAMKSKYREYATTVVVSRALADVRDGMKPVHRRIIYGMYEGGYDWSKGYSKSARIVGDVMGRYHPHGDSSIYDAMARLAQTWSLFSPLIDGQGNFGSPDGDRPAAMRYTEARLSKISQHLVDDLKSQTVPFMPNYDGKDVEPTVLPAAFPNVLVNGGSGIAVGMASDTPTHNLTEVLNATILRMKSPDCSLREVMSALPGPDFPTGARILGTEGIVRAYETGRGTLLLEATTTPDKDGRNPILVYTDMPWGVSKEGLLTKIKELMASGAAPEITSARDESGRNGVRFVVEMRQGSDVSRVDALLKSQTDLRKTISMNFTLLDQNGVPREMPLLDILDAWISFRRITVRRRFNHELGLLRDKGRLLLGRMAALSVLDKVIKLIRESSDRSSARDALLGLSFKTEDFADFISTLGTGLQKKSKKFSLSEEQADHILEMRLQRLTGLEREALAEEAKKIILRMQEVREILSSQERLDVIIISELEAIRSANTLPRQSEITEPLGSVKIKVAPPPIKKEVMRVFVNAEGWLLRASKAEVQDGVQELLTDTHSCVVAFMTDGRSFSVSVTDVPSADSKEGFRSLTGILGTKIEGDVAAFIALSPEADAESVLTFVSADGAVRRTSATEFFKVPQSGKSAMGITDADPRLLTVFKETPAGGAVFMGTAEGKVIRFALKDVRVMAGRGSRGVRGIKLSDDDVVVSAFEVPDLVLTPDVCDEAEGLWLGKRKTGSEDAKSLISGPEVVQTSENGYVKRTLEAAYRQTNRDNRGINDKGPAKGIGRIASYVLISPEQDVVRVGSEQSVAVSEIKKGARATTGGLINAG